MWWPAIEAFPCPGILVRTWGTTCRCENPYVYSPNDRGFEGLEGFSPIWLIDQHAPSSRTPIVLNRALGGFGLLRRCLSDERAQPLVRY